MSEDNPDGQPEKRVAKLLDEIRNERVIRAENHAVYMTRFLGLYTAIVTVLLFLFAVLGFKSISDLHNFEGQMRASVNAVADKKKQVDDEVQNAEQELMTLRAHAQTLEGELDKFESRFTNIRSNSGLASASPVILQTPTSSVGWMTFEGRNFGKKQGAVYAYVQEDASVSAPVRIEPSSIRGWSDKSFSVFLSQNDLASLDKAQRDVEAPPFGESSQGAAVVNPAFLLRPHPTPFLCFQVVTADAKASGWSSPISWR